MQKTGSQDSLTRRQTVIIDKAIAGGYLNNGG